MRRKEGNEEGVITKVVLGFNIATVNVNTVGKGLEGVEGNTYRQDNVESRCVQLNVD